MRKQEANRDRLLAGSRKLRPVARDGSVQVELTPIHQPVSAQRRHPLRGRVDGDERVLFPRARALAVHEPAPQVNHRPPSHPDRDARADLALVEEVREDVSNPLERRIALALGSAHGSILSSPCLRRELRDAY
jgi:hypothetical protein